MLKVVHTIEDSEIREGLFIPRELFAGHKRIEIEIADDGMVTIRPRERSWAEVRQSMDARRKALKAKYGVMEDSTILIREDRDSR